MNPRAEMCKTMNSFGEPLKLYYGNKFVNGAGVFEKIYKKDIEHDSKTPHEFGYDSSQKYSLWAYDFSKIDKVDKVVCDGKTYIVLTGGYDEQLGCFRLIVKEKDK